VANGKVGISYDLGLHSSETVPLSLSVLVVWQCQSRVTKILRTVQGRRRRFSVRRKRREEKGRKGKGNAHLHYAMRYSTCKSVIRQLHIAVYRDRFNPLIFQMLNHEIIFAKISSECNKQFGHYTNSATLNGNCYSLIFHLSTRIEKPLWSDFLFVNL